MDIWHNPRCSKSRQTLALIQENGIEPNIKLYLDSPPTAAELRSTLAMLGISARELLRKGEEDYKVNGLNDTSLSEKALIAAMIESPKLIERPIVLSKGKAVLGRPPKNVLTLLE